MERKDGFYDVQGRFVPANQVGDDYEIESQDREAVEHIRNKLKQGAFRGRSEILEHIQFLEELNAKLTEVLRREQEAARDNWTLKLVQEDIVTLFRNLRQEYLKR